MASCSSDQAFCHHHNRWAETIATHPHPDLALAAAPMKQQPDTEFMMKEFMMKH
jgi:hypothetical protein